MQVYSWFEAFQIQRLRLSPMYALFAAALMILAGCGSSEPCSSNDCREEFGQSFQALNEATLEVWARDEVPNDPQWIKPRIYLKNSTGAAIQNFKVEFYFSLNAGQTPIIEDYSTPNCSVSAVSLGSGNYKVVYNYAGFTLNVGAIAPDLAGTVIGIHLANNQALSNRMTTHYRA